MNPISSRQATGVLLVVLSGWSLTMTAQDGRDGWIVLLLAGLCSLPVAALILSFFAGCVQAGSACQKSHGVWLGAILAGLPCILCAGSNQAFGMAQELYQILFLPVVVLAAGGLFAKVHTKSGS